LQILEEGFRGGLGRPLLQEARQRDHKPGGAVAALKGDLPDERLRDGPPDGIVGGAFDGDDLLPIDFVREGQTRENGAAADENGARPAIAGPTPRLRSAKSESPPERIEEPFGVGYVRPLGR